MPGTAVIDLGFNVDELTPQQKRVVQLLTEVYDLTKKLDGIKVSPIDISGFGQLNKVVSEQNAILTQANKVSTDYAKSVKLAADAEAAQAKARKANSDAQKAETQSENEVIKQINLEAEAERKLAAAKKQRADVKTEIVSVNNTIPDAGATTGTVVNQAELAATQQQLQAQKELSAVRQQGNAELQESSAENQQYTSILASQNEAIDQNIAELELYGDIIGKNTALLEEIAPATEKFVGTIEANQGALNNINSLLAENKSAQALLNKETLNGTIATEEQNASLLQLKNEEGLLKIQAQQLTTTLKNQRIELDATAGSTVQLRARLNNLQAAFERLSAQGQTSKFGLALKNQITLLEPAVKEAEGSIGKFQRNVGNYSGGIGKALGGIFGSIRQLAYILPGIGIAGIFSAAFEAIGKAVSALGLFDDKIDIVGDSIKGTDDNTQRLRSSLRELGDSAEDIADNAFKKLDEATKRLQDDLGETPDAVEVAQGALTILEKKLDDLTEKFKHASANANLTVDFSGTGTGLITNQKVLSNIQQGIDSTTEKIHDGQAKIAENLVESTRKTTLDLGKVNAKLIQNNAQAQIEANRIVLSDNAQSFDAKRGALKSNLEQQRKINQVELQLELNDAKGNAGKIASAKEKFRSDDVKANADYNNQLIETNKKETEAENKILLDSQEAKEALIQDSNRRILSNDKSTLDARLKAIKETGEAIKAATRAELANVLNNPFSSDKDKREAAIKAATDIEKANRDSAEQQNKTREEFRLKDLDAQADIDKQRVQQNADTWQKMSSDDTKAFNIRVSAQKKFIDDQVALEEIEFTNRLQHAGANSVEIDLIKSGNKIKLQQSNLTSQQLEDLEQTHQNKLVSINRDGADKINALTRQEKELQKQIAVELNAEIENIYSSGIAGTAEKIDTETTKLQNKLFSAFKAGSISRNELEKGLRDTALAGQKQQLEAALSSYKQQLSALNPISAEYTDIENKIAHIEEAINGIDLTGADNKLDDLADKFERFAEIAGNINSAFQAIGDISFDNQIADLEEAGAAEEKNYEQQQANIQNSIASEQERADQLKILDSEHAARQEEIARKQREVDNKKAEFDKKIAIMSIILNTAVAVVKALDNPVLAISIAVLGAAQLAAAVATKVPHYAEGLQDAKTDHIGLVGEGKYKELVKRPGMKDFIADKPMLVKLPKHAKVIPLVENANVMANRAIGNGMIIQMQQQEMKPTADGWQEAARSINKQIKKYSGARLKVNVYNDFGNYNYLNKNVFHRK